MVTEVPKLRRCCFCLPLRRGLLFWSYLHMVATGIIAAYGITEFTMMVKISIERNVSLSEYNIIGIGLMYFNIAVNCILSGLLIYGAHKKNHKILKIQYFGATVSVITFYTIVITNMIILLSKYWEYISIEDAVRIVLFCGVLHTTYILIQLYVIVLVRSEVFKLRDNQQFQFNNNAADAEANCTLYIGNKEKSNPTQE